MIDKIKQLVSKFHEQTVADRRHLHMHPELSFEEYQTSAFVKKRLDEMNISWQPIAETGIVATIKGDKPFGQTVALRADMDALPINELNEVEYISKTRGVMHACGHDVHTSSLLGSAMILNLLKSGFGGTVKLLFQPAEEKLPGGAYRMIREGALENPQPCAVIGQHVMPALPAGKVALRKGKLMASMDELFVTVHGKGGHAAEPHKNIDPVLITAHILVALQQIVSRSADPFTPTVLSFGKQIADGAINIIPDSVYLEGTFRTMDEKWRDEAHQLMKDMAVRIAKSMGGSCDFTIVKGYPSLVNEEKLAGQVETYASEYLGKENVIEAAPWMAAEDFAYYSQVIDSCFYLIGTGNTDKGITSSLHTPTFDIDEDMLDISTGLMAYIALKKLGN